MKPSHRGNTSISMTSKLTESTLPPSGHLRHDRIVASVEHARAPALLAEGITVTLRGRTIVDQVDLVVEADEIVGLIGANGAGKTTLMNALSGFLPRLVPCILGRPK